MLCKVKIYSNYVHVVAGGSYLVLVLVISFPFHATLLSISFVFPLLPVYRVSSNRTLYSRFISSFSTRSILSWPLQRLVSQIFPPDSTIHTCIMVHFPYPSAPKLKFFLSKCNRNQIFRHRLSKSTDNVCGFQNSKLFGYHQFNVSPHFFVGGRNGRRINRKNPGILGLVSPLDSVFILTSINTHCRSRIIESNDANQRCETQGAR